MSPIPPPLPTLLPPVRSGSLDKKGNRVTHQGETQREAERGRAPRSDSEGGRGPRSSDAEARFEKRRRKKGITVGIASSLLTAVPNSILRKQYERALQCGSIIIQHEDGTLQTGYCKTRVCTVCNGIRSAHLIDGYTALLESWSAPVMVTLTVPNVKVRALRQTVQGMQKEFLNAVRALRKRGLEVQCVRVTEVTANGNGTVHPHFHVLAASEPVGRALLESWLTRYPRAVRAAQDVRGADKGSLKELFKYLTKLNGQTDPRTLDGILTALRGMHLVRPYGCRVDHFVGTEDEAFDRLERVYSAWKREGESILWVWIDELKNWIDVNPETGEMRDVLCDRAPPPT